MHAVENIICYIDDTEDYRCFKTFEEAEKYYKELQEKLILIEI